MPEPDFPDAEEADAALARPNRRAAVWKAIWTTSLVLVAALLLFGFRHCEISIPLTRDPVFDAKTDLIRVKLAIDDYVIAEERLPSSLKDLTVGGGRNPVPHMQEIPLDPWGSTYRYRTVGPSGYEIRSAGEDKTFDTDDDIVWPRDDW